MGYYLYNIKSSPFKGLDYSYVTSDYGSRTFYNKVTGKYVSNYHRGIDLNSGSIIVAASSGKVVESRNNIDGYSEYYSLGNYVIIYHGNNIFSVYAHMKYGSVKVKVGDIVDKGQELGYIGATGYATGIHLHFAVKENDTYVNPLDYLLGKKELPSLVPEEKNTNINDNTNNNEIEYIKYVIKYGDTLSEIAMKYNTTYQELARINNIENPNLIYAGHTLKIPKSSSCVFSIDNDKKEESYVVKPGDNLSYIAKMYNTTWQKIYENNKSVIGNNPNLIYPGQVLKI